MEILIAQIINGLSLGSIYVLLVTGFNLLLLVAVVIHFSFPVVVVFSMYMAWIAMQASGSVLAGIAASILSAIAVNMVSAPVFQHIMRKRGAVDINATMVVSMGLGMLITEYCSHNINKGFPVSFLAGETDSAGWIRNIRRPCWQYGLISISYSQVLTLAAGVTIVVLLFCVLYKTRTGRAFRAVAESPDGARLAGIPLFRTGIQGYALTGVLGGITAVLMALLLGTASPDLGNQLGHKVLGISIIAGLGNLPGGLVIALLLGIAEAIVQGFFSGSWSNAVIFIIMLAVVLVKPKGIFGIKL